MSFVPMTIAAGEATPDQRKAGRDRLARWSRPVLGLLLPVFKMGSAVGGS